jgi:hypothetical protein
MVETILYVMTQICRSVLQWNVAVPMQSFVFLAPIPSSI